jgi:hypothetical protein
MPLFHGVAILEIIGGDGKKIVANTGCYLAVTPDEATGRFAQDTAKQYPGYKLAGLKMHEIPSSTVLAAAREIGVRKDTPVPSHEALENEIRGRNAVIDRARRLIGLLTVRQVIFAGDEAIEAAGINPWAVNEGLASGDEPIDTWWMMPSPPGDEDDPRLDHFRVSGEKD